MKLLNSFFLKRADLQEWLFSSYTADLFFASCDWFSNFVYLTSGKSVLFVHFIKPAEVNIYLGLIPFHQNSVEEKAHMHYIWHFNQRLVLPLFLGRKASR